MRDSVNELVQFDLNDDERRHEVERELFEHPGHLIRRLHQISVSIFLSEATKYDLTQTQYGCLTLVDFYPGIDQSSLGRAVALDRQTVSNLVRRLIQKGLLRREPKNRRNSALFVTGAGKALHHAMRDRLEVVDKTLLSPLNPDEQYIFQKLLTTLVTELNSLSRAPQKGLDDLKSLGTASE